MAVLEVSVALNSTASFRSMVFVVSMLSMARIACWYRDMAWRRLPCDVLWYQNE